MPLSYKPVVRISLNLQLGAKMKWLDFEVKRHVKTIYTRSSNLK